MMNLTPRLNRLEPNIIIDGGMEIWPEGTSRSIVNNSDAYGAVLFKNHNGSTGVTLTASQQTSVPSGTELVYSSQLSKTAAGTMAASTYCFKAYNIEGYNINSMYKQETSLIFFVKSSVASNRSISIQNTGFTHSYVQQYNITQANTWELKVLKLPALNTCPGSLNRTNGLGARIVFSVVHGTTYQTASLNQWISGLYSAGIGEDTTWVTGTNHDFSIAGVMVLPGDWTGLTAANYDFARAGRNFQDELSMTQRYLEKSYDLDVPPGTIGNQGAIRGQTIANGIFRAWVSYVPKRVPNPSITYYNPATGTAGQMKVSASDVAMSTTFFGQRNFSAENTASTANADAYFHWVVDARF